MSIYIKEGNSYLGEWRGLFISMDEGDSERVITALSGSVDFDGRKVELVLKDVTSIKYPHNIASEESKSIVTERLKFLRLEVADNLAERKSAISGDGKPDFEEMTNTEILTKASEGDKHSTESHIQFQRRLALSFAPIVLALVGFWAAMSFNRSSKTFGLIFSLTLLITYYLVFLIGEQLTRMNILPTYIGGWLANILFIVLMASANCLPLHLNWLRKSNGSFRRNTEHTESNEPLTLPNATRIGPTNAGMFRNRGFVSQLLRNGLMGYLDISIISRTLIFFTISYSTFVSIFIMFTFFDIWKSIFTNKIPMALVLKYLLFLLPLVTIQILGPCILIATFVTFLLMTNRNEVLVWLSSGTSIYRQLATTIVLGLSIVAIHWSVQEYAMPKSNIIQDSLRSQIKTGYPKVLVSSGRQWLAIDKVFFNYEFDNSKNVLKSPKVYSLDDAGQLSSIWLASEAKWNEAKGMILVNSIQIKASDGHSLITNSETVLGNFLPPAYFSTFLSKPFYLTATELKEQIRIMKSRGEDATQLSIAFYKRYSGPFASVVSVIIGASIALIFRKGRPFIQIITMLISGIAFLLIVQFSINWGVSLGFPILLACVLPYLFVVAIGVYFVALIKT
jgi:lipopolysaccharide export LptBFGC system permease protein LptF